MFSNYIEAVDNDINNKLESMYKELNDEYNNIVSVFNEVVIGLLGGYLLKK